MMAFVQLGLFNLELGCLGGQFSVCQIRRFKVQCVRDARPQRPPRPFHDRRRGRRTREGDAEAELDSEDAETEKLQTQQSKTEKAAPTEKVSLLRLLVSRKVAAAETCAFLVATGKVEVNGNVERDPNFSVDVSVDDVMTGRLVVNKGAEPKHTFEEDDEKWWQEHGSRGRRDFPQSRAIQLAEKIGRKFSSKVDEGFLAKWSKPRKSKK
mmetsp:Transcript_17206/g.35756  ORF Transcript_17206/g.35756 Transcript_17206/m.35756 type:complete len:210 (-) Transcript_17206:4286-4915(-)